MSDATKREVQIAMLESLKASFRMADTTGEFQMSFNAGDVADLLGDCIGLMGKHLRVVK